MKNTFAIGMTRTRKLIYNRPEDTRHLEFTAQEHREAAELHRKRADRFTSHCFSLPARICLEAAIYHSAAANQFKPQEVTA
jgi:hypothetical protein